MRERGRDQTAGLDLTGAAGAFAGEDRMGLEERDRILNGSVVGLLDPARDLGRRDRPQRRDRLRRTEREVEAGHRSLPEPPPQRGAGDRMTAVAEQVAASARRSPRRRTRCRRSRSGRSRPSGQGPRPSPRSSRPAGCGRARSNRRRRPAGSGTHTPTRPRASSTSSSHPSRPGPGREWPPRFVSERGVLWEERRGWRKRSRGEVEWQREERRGEGAREVR